MANFHLRNGASIAHLHWGADLSSRGRAGSYGIMVNYECAQSLCANSILPNLHQYRMLAFMPTSALVLCSGHYADGEALEMRGEHSVAARYVLDEVARNNEQYLVDGPHTSLA